MTAPGFGVLVVAALLAALPGDLRAQLWKGQVGDLIDLERRARRGDPEAMAELAWHLVEGQGGRKFVASEIHGWFEKAARAGSVLGKAGLSRCLTDGIGAPADYSRAWDLARDAADEKHPEGLKQAGRLLYDGLGVRADREEGLDLTRQAALEGGSVAAKVNLVVFSHRTGEGPLGRERCAEIALETGSLAAARNALFDYVFTRGDSDRFEQAMKVIDLVAERARLEHPTALVTLAFVRSCQGADDEAAMLELRAAATGVQEGLRKVVDNLARSGNQAGAYPATPKFFTRPLHLRRFEWQDYRQGERSGWLAGRIARSLLQPLDDRQPDPAMALRVLREGLPDPEKSLHVELAQQLLLQQRELGKSLMPGHLAVAHCVYASDKKPSVVGFVAHLLSGEQAGVEPDLAKAYAAARRATDGHWPEERVSRLGAKLSPEQMQEAESLIESGYPTAERFIEEAKQVLEQAGELPAQD